MLNQSRLRKIAAAPGALGLVMLLATPAWAGTLKVAAAASAQEALVELGDRFERRSGDRVRFSFGSSGKLYHQIRHGAPFDLYFSADVDYPRQLAGAGLVDAPQPYATGRLVLWAPRGSPIAIDGGLAVLEDPRVRHVAIANPRVAPYGRAAKAAMRHAGVWSAAAPKLVVGENIAQAAQFVESGGADVAILPLSLAVSPRLAPRGRHWPVPSAWHQPLAADAAVVTASPNQALARRFLAFVRSQEAAPVWRRYGFTPR